MVKAEDVPEIVDEHLLKGRIVKRLLYNETVPRTDTVKIPERHRRSTRSSMRVALRNCGVINPENIDEYIAVDGYAGAGQGADRNDPGAGHPDDPGFRPARPRRRGLPHRHEVELCGRPTEADQKYVCCNADEGDPGAFMDRSVLEGDPHVVIEAMAIAGYAIGANQGYIYVRAEYPIAVTAPADRHRSGPGIRPAGQEYLRHRLLTLIWRSVWAPARSSAARRPR